MVFGAALALTLAGCGGERDQAVSPDGKAVIRDVLDGRLDENWSCASLQAAIRRLPPGGGPTYTTIPDMLEQAATHACGRE